MQLPFLAKKQQVEYFLALLLRDEKATAVVFEEIGGKVQLVAEHEEYFEDSIEDATIDEWLEVIDKAISEAESILPKHAHLSKTIFGVTEHWVEEAKIKKDYLSKLKKVSDELQLEPIGFMVIHEAITHLLKKEEGAPVSAILVEVGKRILIVSLLRAGKIIETRQTRIEESIPKTVDLLLHHFQQYEVLPSRVIILNAQDSQKLSQEFISHHFSKDLPFLHVPQITTLPKRFDAKAVLYGAATQMGFEMLQDEDEQTIKPEQIVSETTQRESQEKQSDLKTATADDFGFVLEKDIAEMEKPEPSHTVHTEYESEPVEKEEEKTGTQETLEEIAKPTHTKKKPMIHVHLPHLNLPSLPINNKLFYVVPLLLLISIALFLSYIFFLKSTVVLDITPKIVEQDQAVTFTPDASSDFAKSIISATSVSVEKDGSTTTPATGKKEVGDKAKGSVTFYSRRSQDTTFLAQTPLTGPNGLEFTLDKEVKVASSSGDASASPSTAKGAVTAKQIGKESNLPSNSKFGVGTYDEADVVAKNDSAFSGGSKKELTVVAKADLEKLTSELPKSLQKDAESELSKKISKDQTLLPLVATPTLSKKDFDKKVNDEASSVSLKGTVVFDGHTYKKGDLKQFSKQLLQGKTQGLTLSEDGLSFQLKDVKQKDEKSIVATLHVKGMLVPHIDKQKASSDIVGKSFEEAQKILLKLPQVSNISIHLHPNVPFLPDILPHLPKNINLILQNK